MHILLELKNGQQLRLGDDKIDLVAKESRSRSTTASPSSSSTHSGEVKVEGTKITISGAGRPGHRRHERQRQGQDGAQARGRRHAEAKASASAKVEAGGITEVKGGDREDQLMAGSLPQRPHDEDSTFVGRGFAWPLEVDNTGALRLSNGVAELDDSIRIVLMTAPGERLMRPKFGCRIWELLFEPITANLLGLINQSVRDALAQWEPRITVEEVVATPATQPGLVDIHIGYRVRSTNDRRNLVYPFYVIPHDAE